METSDKVSPTREISRGIVSIYKEYLGRGPTHAKTTIHQDYVLVLCTDGLTKAERKLVTADEADAVRSIRRKFQAAMRRDMGALVERVTGRKVEVLLSDHDVETDTAVEVLVFDRDEIPHE